MGSVTGLESMEKIKISCPCQESNTFSPVVEPSRCADNLLETTIHELPTEPRSSEFRPESCTRAVPNGSKSKQCCSEFRELWWPHCMPGCGQLDRSAACLQMIYLLTPDLIMRTRGTEREEKDKKKEDSEYGENYGMRDGKRRMGQKRRSRR